MSTGLATEVLAPVRPGILDADQDFAAGFDPATDPQALAAAAALEAELEADLAATLAADLATLDAGSRSGQGP